MSAIRHKDTRPELTVRKMVHALGYRFRLHRNDLPGKPDLSFIFRRKVVFVHGCFWHRHSCPKGQSLPNRNAAFWKEKLEKNSKRDQRHRSDLRKMGWGVLVIWECELRRPEKVALKLSRFLDQPGTRDL